MIRSAARRGLFAIVLFCACVLAVLGGHDARANMAKWWSEGEAHGVLVPQSDTDVRVDSEDLSFVVEPSLARAEVTATYHMTNGGNATTHADVAFVMLAAEYAEMPRTQVQGSVMIDGEPVAGRIVTEAEVLGPVLDAWLAEHPAAEAELSRLASLALNPGHAEYEALRRFAPGCAGECTDLRRWYSAKKQADSKAGDEARRELVVRAAEEAVPAKVAALQNGWGAKSSRARRLSWLLFPLEIAAGASRTVTVHYTHVAGSDASHAVNTVFTYEYLLSPAKRWARFGDLQVTIKTPPGSTVYASSLPFTRTDATTWRANLSGLPSGELSFEVMSRAGLLFGMTQPTGYWLLLLAAMSLITAPVSARLGRLCGRAASPASRILGSIFGVGIASLAWNGAVMAALSALFPQRAFGHGYDALLGLLLALALFTIVAVVVSLVTGSRVHRRGLG